MLLSLQKSYHTLALRACLVGLLGFISLSTTGCFVHRHTVGKGPYGKVNRSKLVKLGSKKTLYLFWGGISLNHPDIERMAEGFENYQVKTSFNWVDGLVSGLTGGIFSMRTVKVFVWRDDWQKMRDQKKRGKTQPPVSQPNPSPTPAPAPAPTPTN